MNRYAKSETMPTDQPAPEPAAGPAAATPETALAQSARRPLSPAAQRALAEAAARRAEGTQGVAANPDDEINGRGGLDPTRYGDWEINGLASDF